MRGVRRKDDDDHHDCEEYGDDDVDDVAAADDDDDDDNAAQIKLRQVYALLERQKRTYLIFTNDLLTLPSIKVDFCALELSKKRANTRTEKKKEKEKYLSHQSCFFSLRSWGIAAAWTSMGNDLSLSPSPPSRTSTSPAPAPCKRC